MDLTIIAALSDDYVIGKGNTLPWYIPDDLHRFKQLTMGTPVIMGRATYESIDNPLSGRDVHILTSQEDYVPKHGGTVHHSLEDMLRAVDVFPDVFVAGGSKVYEQLLPLADRMELTWVHKDVYGDSFFPPVDWSKWKETEREDCKGYSFVSYVSK